jgi:hypothetical protein
MHQLPENHQEDACILRVPYNAVDTLVDYPVAMKIDLHPAFDNRKQPAITRSEPSIISSTMAIVLLP